MHPRFRGVYARWLAIRRHLQPDSFIDGDPFEVVYVDPNEIEYAATNLPLAWGRVLGGEWEYERFEEKDWIARERFCEGKDWSEISYPVSEAEQEKWDRLYRSIQEHGYLSQAELASTSDNWNWDCEVGVAIDRDGEIVWIGRGFHRLAVAKILDIDVLPVQVRIRHPEWETGLSER